MSKPCCAIDVHTHVVPAHLPDERPEFAGLPWPSIKHTDACHAQVIISGKNYRDINDACWSVPRRTEQMRRHGCRHAGPVADARAPVLLAADQRRVRAGAAHQRDHRRDGARRSRPLPSAWAWCRCRTWMPPSASSSTPCASSASRASRSRPTSTAWRWAIPRSIRSLPPPKSLGAAIFVHPLRPAGMDRLVGPAQPRAGRGLPVRDGTCHRLGDHRRADEAPSWPAHRFQPRRRRLRPGAAAHAARLVGDGADQGRHGGAPRDGQKAFL